MVFEDIIFDFNVFVVVIGIEEYDNYGIDFINVIKWIIDICLYVYILGGVLNLLFSFCGNEIVCEVMYVVFLYYVIQNGMDMGIVNVGQLVVYFEIDFELCEVCEDVVMNCCSDVIEWMLDLVEKFCGEGGSKVKEKDFSWCELFVEKWFEYVLVNGIIEYIDVDIEEVC